MSPKDQDPPRSATSDQPREASAPGPATAGDSPTTPATTTGDRGSAKTGRGRRGRKADTAPNMLPGRERRRFGLERVLIRLIATGGIVGIGVVIAAIMTSSKSQGWIIGLVVSIVSVVLSAILWSSRSL